MQVLNWCSRVTAPSGLLPGWKRTWCGGEGVHLCPVPCRGLGMVRHRGVLLTTVLHGHRTRSTLRRRTATATSCASTTTAASRRRWCTRCVTLPYCTYGTPSWPFNAKSTARCRLGDQCGHATRSRCGMGRTTRLRMHSAAWRGHGPAQGSVSWLSSASLALPAPYVSLKSFSLLLLFAWSQHEILKQLSQQKLSFQVPT